MKETEQNDRLIVIESRKTPSGEFYPPQVTFYLENIRSLSRAEKKAILVTIQEAARQYDGLFND